MSKDLVKSDYEGYEISFNEDGWFDATAAAEKFGKKPNEWLRLPETERYVEALCKFYNTGKSRIIKTKKGKAGGTWFHPDLAVVFARWLNIDFAIWCDQQIKSILTSKHPKFDWKKVRHEASSSFKVMNEALKIVREAQGKTSKEHHYSNEARLVNKVLKGEFKSINRDELTLDELDMLAKLEVKNTVMIAQGFTYNQRKDLLVQYADVLRPVERIE